MTQLILYTTSACHLCEQAAEILQELQKSYSFDVKPLDISADELLVEKYGIRIPVVRNNDLARELGWPFNAEDIMGLLN